MAPKQHLVNKSMRMFRANIASQNQFIYIYIYKNPSFVRKEIKDHNIAKICRHSILAFGPPRTQVWVFIVKIRHPWNVYKISYS